MIDPIKTDLVFTPLFFTQNRIEHYIDAAPVTVTDRHTLRYFLAILCPPNSTSQSFELITTAEGREAPPIPPFITSEGCRFLINDDTNGLLDGLLTARKPQPNQSSISVISTLTLPVLLQSSIQGGTPEPDQETETKIWIYKGGLSGADFANYGTTFFDIYQQDARRFLTWHQPVKHIGIESEEYLYFLSNFLPLPSGLRLRIEVTHADFSETTHTVFSITNLIQNQVYCFPTGPQILNVPSDAVAYNVWVSDLQDNRISELRRYVLDHRNYDQVRQIIFQNSFNTYDTLRLTGEAATTLSVSKTRSSLDQFGNANRYDFPEFRIVSVTGTQEITISTGYFHQDSRHTIKYLSELLLSQDIYLKTDSGHLPVELITSELVTDLDNPTAPLSRTFTFRVLKKHDRYSDLPTATLAAARPTGYTPIDLVHILLPNGYRSGYIKGSRIKKIYLDTYEDVKPISIKPNDEGDPDYVPPIFNDAVANTTPFPSAYLEKDGTFIRAACPNPVNIPGPATIIIAEGTFGGEKQSDADALADIAYRVLNTQDYANLYGRCDDGPWTYTAAVPVNFARFRINKPVTGYAANGVSKYNDGSTIIKGNGWWCFGPEQSTSDVYSPGTWDIDLPTNWGSNSPWNFNIYSPASRVRIFSNAALIYDNTAPVFNSGQLNIKIPHASITSQAKVYIQID